jgi:TrmH family RNA methyltransferase
MTAVREIASPSNPLIKEVKALRMKKRRDETGLFLAEGARVVAEALDAGTAPETFIYARDARDFEATRRLRERALAAGAEVVETPPAILEKIARKDNPQNVIGVFRQAYAPLAALDPARSGVFVALEGVKDPGNLGTIIRTVDAVGGGGVILIGQTCDPYSVEAVRATMGSIFAVPVWRASLDEFAALAARWPGPIIGAALQTDADYRAASYPPPTILLMGAEQSGLSPAARRTASALVRMPMRGRADSLNLAVATGVLLYRALDFQTPLGG